MTPIKSDDRLATGVWCIESTLHHFVVTFKKEGDVFAEWFQSSPNLAKWSQVPGPLRVLQHLVNPCHSLQKIPSLRRIHGSCHLLKVSTTELSMGGSRKASSTSRSAASPQVWPSLWKGWRSRSLENRRLSTCVVQRGLQNHAARLGPPSATASLCLLKGKPIPASRTGRKRRKLSSKFYKPGGGCTMEPSAQMKLRW